MFHNEAINYLDKSDFQLFQPHQKGDWFQKEKDVTHWISFRKEAGRVVSYKATKTFLRALHDAILSGR